MHRSSRVAMQWERRTGRRYYDVPPQERAAVNDEIRALIRGE